MDFAHGAPGRQEIVVWIAEFPEFPVGKDQPFIIVNQSEAEIDALNGIVQELARPRLCCSLLGDVEHGPDDAAIGQFCNGNFFFGAVCNSNFHLEAAQLLQGAQNAGKTVLRPPCDPDLPSADGFANDLQHGRAGNQKGLVRTEHVGITAVCENQAFFTVIKDKAFFERINRITQTRVGMIVFVAERKRVCLVNWRTGDQITAAVGSVA